MAYFKLLVLFSTILANSCFADARIAEDKFSEDAELLLVKSALKNTLSNKVDKIDIEYDYADGQGVKNSDATIVRVTRIMPKFGAFKARIYYLDNTAKEIHGKYRAFTEAPMVNRYIKQGEILSEQDLSQGSLDITKNDQTFVSGVEQIIGQQVKRDLLPGYVLKNSDLIAPTMVKVNDEVTVFYQNPNIEVKASGHAMKAGAVGDVILVKNDRSNKIISGKVIGKGLVQVNGDHHAN
jgi:flagella basal body P-ring formation protein FlgA